MAGVWGSVVPRQDVGDHGGFDRIELQALGITGALGIHDRPIGGDAPGQQLPTAPRRLAATSHPVGDQGAFILGHGTPDLEQELIVRVLTHRPVQALDLTAPLGEFVNEEHLMHIVAGPPIGGREQDPCKGGQGGAIPQPIQAGPIQLGPTITIVAVDMFLSQMPHRAGSPQVREDGPAVAQSSVFVVAGWSRHGHTGRLPWDSSCRCDGTGQVPAWFSIAHGSRQRSTEAIGKHWCLVFVGLFAAAPDVSAGWTGAVAGPHPHHGGRLSATEGALLQRLLMFVHDQLSNGATVAQVFTQVFAKQRGMAPA